jgi:5-hydroxyisourate hydrolase
MSVGLLTTHVLNTATGRPAKGVNIELYVPTNNSRQLICSRITNHDGRCDQPLLLAHEMYVGMYELDFVLSDYFSDSDAYSAEPCFLSTITIRFGISDTNENYHIPLLVSPYGYSTYRGS